MSRAHAASGGEDVALSENPEGIVYYTVNRRYKLIIMKIVVPANVEEERRCGHCHRWLPVMEFDRNAGGQLLRTCRSCLVRLSMLFYKLYHEV